MRELGGVGGALASKAARIYASFGEGEKAIARRAFLAMVQLGEGTRDTRRRARLRDIVIEGQSEETVLSVLRRFAGADGRMISIDSATTHPETTIEVAHEALFEHWPELQSWLNESRDDLRFERRLQDAADQWRDGRRDEAPPGGARSSSCSRAIASAIR